MRRTLLAEVSRAASQCATSSSAGHDARLESVIGSGDVQGALGLQWPPPIQHEEFATDGKEGYVAAVRLDWASFGVGLKHPVVGALLARQALLYPARFRRARLLIDGGNVNTALAVAHYARLMDAQGIVVMSRHFPRDVIEYLVQHGKGHLEVVQAPQANRSIEREFYEHALELAGGSSRRGSIFLGHAKHGGKVLHPLGRALALRLPAAPDVIVLSIGSGSTLEGLAIPVRERFGGRPRIVAVEHEDSQLLPASIVRFRLDDPGRSAIDHKWASFFRRPPDTIPHAVLGPHYEELNPLLDQTALRGVDSVVVYSDEQWQTYAGRRYERGHRIGNSSAVNLAVSEHLAARGLKVLTFVYEPFRWFYAAGAKSGSKQHPVLA